MSYLYIAQPYSHPKKTVQPLRAAVGAILAAAILEGKIPSVPKPASVFSPITHSHPIAEAGNLPETWDYWREFDRPFLESASGLVVLCMYGWDRSVGVLWEIERAKELGLPITYVLLEDMRVVESWHPTIALIFACLLMQEVSDGFSPNMA